MQFKVKRKDQTCCVSIAGELDHHSAKSASNELDKIIAKEKLSELILDLKGISFMDSSGLGVVLGRYKVLKEKGATLKFINVPSGCDRLFSMSGVYAIAKKLD